MPQWGEAGSRGNRGDPKISGPRETGGKGETMDSRWRNDFMLLDVFSTAFIFTGSAEMALQETVHSGASAEPLKVTMTGLRNGSSFEHALGESGIPRDLSDWFYMVCSGSAKDSQLMLDSWKAEASKCLAKTEDATSLVITFSCLLPVVLASLLLMVGYLSSLLAFSISFMTIVGYWLVSRWMRRLNRPLN